MLYVNNNRLSGGLPFGGFKMWLKLKSLDVSHNHYEMTIVDFICDWFACQGGSGGSSTDHALSTFSLNNNRFFGNILF